MDRLESLGNTLSQITLYDIKSMYNQAKNMVLNVSEIEAKVQEATNDEPWGASSTLMNEIAQGTFSFQHFNEIMPAIYSRFMDKEARQWRQIYKALQLLEYLVKHGSERVVDDARSHVSTLKMLRSFHYIDDKGKDEGINVRNRAKELVELLSDVEKIRTERRKAKANKHKYTGTGNDAGFGGGYGGSLSFSSGGSRYGGFGSDSLGGGGGSSYERDSYGGGGSGSNHSGGFRESSTRGGYEEYDAGGDEIDMPRRSNSITASRASPATGSSRTSAAKAKATPTPPPPPPPQPEVDLLGGFDDPIPAPNTATKTLPPAAAVSLDDDDFADFQAAPTTPVPAPASPPANAHARGASKPTLMDMLHSSPAVPTNQQRSNMTTAQQAIFGNAMRSPVAQAQQNMFGGGMTPASPPPFQQQMQRGNTMSPQVMSPQVMSPTTLTPSTPASANTKPAPAPSKGGGFDDLWSMSLGSANKPAAPVVNKSMKDLEREKAQSGLWGSGGAKPASQQPFGAFGNAAPSSSSSGGDDLLL